MSGYIFFAGLLLSAITPHCFAQQPRSSQRNTSPLQPVEALPQPLLTPEEYFRRAGSGLRGIEAERQNYWQLHIHNSQRRILEAASLCKRHSTALVLGAGNCTEIPLEQLARQFDQVILVDLDADSMGAAIESLPDELASKVHLRRQDVTTFAGPLMQRVWQLVEKSSGTREALDGLERTLAVQDENAAPKLPQADLVVSSLVLSELHRYPLSYASRLMLDKFGERLAAWPGYERFRARLQQIALQDHVSLLAESLLPGGAIYYADTIERGPLYENIEPEQRQQVLVSMFADLGELGLFNTIQPGAPLGQTFSAVFAKMRPRWGAAGPPSAALPGELGQTSPEEDRGAAAETVINLLCEERFPVDAEIAAFERVLQRYSALPNSFEPLVPLDAMQQEWRSHHLQVSGTPESWWWLEYPCSISYSSGAFQIRSWLLTKS